MMMYVVVVTMNMIMIVIGRGHGGWRWNCGWQPHNEELMISPTNGGAFVRVDDRKIDVVQGAQENEIAAPNAKHMERARKSI
jgi:hypothetical protein